MGRDVDYWKRAYAHLWSEAAKKERILKEIIENETGLILESYGIGAESDAFIHGSAKSNDYERSAPDFKIKDINIFIEITGPLSEKALPQNGLWLRPDKLNYAQAHRHEADEFFALYFPSNQTWYTIHADDEFFQYSRGVRNKTDFFDIRPVIRGRQERYIVINISNPYVKDLNSLIEYLKRL